jgi:hypothetical protein
VGTNRIPYEDYAIRQAILIKLCDRIENLIDEQDLGETFLSVYSLLPDLLIVTLSDSAIEHGYIRALEMLKAILRNYTG